MQVDRNCYIDWTYENLQNFRNNLQVGQYVDVNFVFIGKLVQYKVIMHTIDDPVWHCYIVRNPDLTIFQTWNIYNVESIYPVGYFTDYYNLIFPILASLHPNLTRYSYYDYHLWRYLKRFIFYN